MTPTLYLHIGLPKSGTTFLQAVLQENRDRLWGRDRLTWPGPAWTQHVRAASDLLDKRPAALDDPRGAWEQALDEIRSAGGRGGVISMEWLCQAEPHHLERLRETLGDLELRVIVTVRGLAHTLPSAWQEFCQNWEVPSWPEFLDAVASDSAMDTHISRVFWTEQELGKILPRWTDAFSTERVIVVTVPPRGDTVALWRRFAETLGIEAPDVYDTAVRGANSSLGVTSAELMRRVNVVSHRDNLPADTYQRAFKVRLAKRVLAERRPLESPVRLPKAYAEFVADRAARQVAQVQAVGVPVIGDLDDLTSIPEFVEEVPNEQPADALLEAAVDGLVGLGRLLDGEQSGRLAELDGALRRVEELEVELERREEAREAELSDLRERSRRWKDQPLREAVISVSESRPAVMRARVAYWNVVNAQRRLRGLPTP